LIFVWFWGIEYPGDLRGEVCPSVPQIVTSAFIAEMDTPDHSRLFGKYGGGVLLACLFLVLFFGYVILRPFIGIFFLALVLSIVAQPAHRRILRLTRNRKSLSAFLTCVLVVLLIIIPSVTILTLLTHESLQIYNVVNEKIQAGLYKDLGQRIVNLQQRFLPHLDLKDLNVGDSISQAAGKLSQFLVTLSTGLLKALTTTLWGFLMMLFALFYFIRDGEECLTCILHLIPLAGSLKARIYQRFTSVSESAFYGTFLTALAQGLLGAIGFMIVGFQPLVWGVIMVFFSLIPVVGTALIWVPAAGILFMSNRLVAGLFLVVWGIMVIGGCDNVIRAVFMRGKSQLHPLLIFFSLIGGMLAFGPLGVILGPLAMVLVIALLQAYEQAAQPVLEELDKR
jgi:predicted PurR-regulated permease PerM